MPSIAEAAASPPPTITYLCFMPATLALRRRQLARTVELALEPALPGAARGPRHDNQSAHRAGDGDDPGDAESTVVEEVRNPERERDAQQREAAEDDREGESVPRAQHGLGGHDLPAVEDQAQREDAQVGHADRMHTRIAREEREEEI